MGTAVSRLVMVAQATEADSVRSAQAAVDDNTLSVRTPWLNRTKWQDRFAGKDMSILIKMCDKPNQSEAWLLDLWGDLRGLIRRCNDGLKDLMLRDWERILHWVASANRESARKTPMNVYLKLKTIDEYGSYWQRFICFCLRMLDENGDETGGLRFTEEQRTTLEELRAIYILDGDGTDAELKRKQLLRTSIRFIRQTVWDVGTPALVVFSGILGYKKDTGRWREPEHYTNILAGILWCMRVLVLEYTLPTSSRDRVAEDAERTPLERVKLVRDECLVEEEDCPFATLHSLMVYGLALAKNRVGAGTTSWSHDGRYLAFKGRQIGMAEWKGFIKDLTKTAEQKLASGLLFQKNTRVPGINLWEVEDDQSRADIGYYFGRKDTGEWKEARERMLRWLEEAQDSYSLIDDDGEGGAMFVPTAVDKYRALDREFRELLYLLVLATGGPPLRGTEMASLKYMNTQHGKRNIFVCGGQAMLVTEYNKTDSVTKQQKVPALFDYVDLTEQTIARFSNAAVSRLLITYLRYVIPFIRMIAGNNDISANAFLFGDSNGPWETRIFTRSLEKETAKGMGFQINTNMYRHIAIAIDRKFIRPRDPGDDSADEEDESDGENPFDAGAGHSMRVAINSYARVRNLTSGLTPESIDIFRAICDRWHKWLGTASRDVRPAEESVRVGLTEHEKRQEIGRIMAELHGTGYRWLSPQQKEAVESSVSGISPLFIILPTGTGKTLAFLVPAMMKGSKVTVVITPLIALGEDLVRRCSDAGLDSVLYRQSSPRRAKVVVVVTETAGGDEFRQFIMDLQMEGRLERVVWDEAHKLATDKQYRLAIDDSNKLALRVPVMFISATCPPNFINQICESMVLPEPHVIRQEYIKPSFIYSVRVCDNLKREIKERLRRWIENRDVGSKMLVFCRTKGECNSWAREYGGRKYYSGLADKAQQLADWMEGLMFATGALGAGLDIDGIEDVMHVGMPYAMADYIQESGRGGRKGEVVRADVFLSWSDYSDLMAAPEEGLTDDELALQKYLRGDICRNEALTVYLNGRELGKNCRTAKSLLCDVCQGRTEYRELKRKQDATMVERDRAVTKRRMYDQQAQMKEELVRRMARIWERIEHVLAEIGMGCPLCWFLEMAEFAGHGMRDCQVWREAFGTLSAGELRRRHLDLAGLKNTCWTCGLPGDRCEMYSTQRIKCQRQDFVFPVAVYFSVVKDTGYWETARKTLKRDYLDLSELCNDLVKRARCLEENGCVGFSMWVEIFKIRARV